MRGRWFACGKQRRGFDVVLVCSRNSSFRVRARLWFRWVFFNRLSLTPFNRKDVFCLAVEVEIVLRAVSLVGLQSSNFRVEDSDKVLADISDARSSLVFSCGALYDNQNNG